MRPRSTLRSITALIRKPLWLVQVIGVLLLVAGGIATFAFARAAGAGTGPGASGNTITNAAQAIQPFTPGPFDSGQGIDVVIPPNSVFTSGSEIFILECAAPDGVDPTTTTECDGNTSYGGGSITVNSDGSVDVVNGSSGSGLPYQVFLLPDPRIGDVGGGAGATCGLGAANECVLYIGEGGGSDTGMTLPHFFSQAFQVHSDPTDSGTIDPGDGTPQAVTSVSPTNSTVTPTTQDVTADGSDPAVVTVTLKDDNSVPVSGKTVSLAAGSGHATVANQGVGSNVTDENGQARFVVTDNTAETVTLSATDTTDSIAVTQTASVTFMTPTINQSATTVTANPTSVPADGTTASTITVTIRDNSVAPGQPAPISGLTVQLTAENGSSTITPVSPLTNANGQATFTVTDTANEIVTYKGAVGATALTATASVAFGTVGTVSATKSTVVADPSPAFTGVGNGTTVTVTLFASDGSTPISGKSVELALSGHASISGPTSVTTDASGKAVFGVVDSTVETVTITATDTTDTPNIVLASQPQVMFETPPPPGISASLTMLSISYPNNTPPPADGSTAAVLDVTVHNTLGAVVPNVEVTASVTPSTTARVAALQGKNTTGSNGLVQFNVTDTKAETVTLSAKQATVGGVAFTQTVTATFLPGLVNANTSRVSASPIQVPADGTTPSTVTVTLLDYFSNPLAGHPVTLSASGGSSVITPVQSSSGVMPGTSDANGVAKFFVTDAKNEVATYTATDTTASLVVKQLASVTFGTPPPVLPVKADCTVVVNSQKVPANGATSGTITVELRDGNGFPVEGKTVALTPSGGSSVIVGTKVVGSVAAPSVASTSKAASVKASASSTSSTTTSTTPVAPSAAAGAVTAVSNSNGDAVFTVTDKVPETVTYTAADTTDGLSGWTVAVTYTAATTTPTTVPTTTTTPSPGTTGATSDTSGTSGAGGSGATGVSDTSATNPTLAFTGAPAALPWIFGIGALLLALGTIGRVALAVRRRGQ